jgi:hypothetical protein
MFSAIFSTADTLLMPHVVISIYCSKTVNHRLTGPGKMVKLCLLFMGIQTQNAIDIPVTLNYCY